MSICYSQGPGRVKSAKGKKSKPGPQYQQTLTDAEGSVSQEKCAGKTAHFSKKTPKVKNTRLSPRKTG